MYGTQFNDLTCFYLWVITLINAFNINVSTHMVTFFVFLDVSQASYLNVFPVNLATLWPAVFMSCVSTMFNWTTASPINISPLALASIPRHHHFVYCLLEFNYLRFQIYHHHTGDCLYLPYVLNVMSSRSILLSQAVEFSFSRWDKILGHLNVLISLVSSIYWHSFG